MARKLSVSFKETKRDMELYNLIMAMDDKSYWIKDVLRKAINKEEKQTNKSEINKKDLNVLNF
jgi:hypothetical protein